MFLDLVDLESSQSKYCLVTNYLGSVSRDTKGIRTPNIKHNVSNITNFTTQNNSFGITQGLELIRTSQAISGSLHNSLNIDYGKAMAVKIIENDLNTPMVQAYLKPIHHTAARKIKHDIETLSVDNKLERGHINDLGHSKKFNKIYRSNEGPI